MGEALSSVTERDHRATWSRCSANATAGSFRWASPQPCCCTLASRCGAPFLCGTESATNPMVGQWFWKSLMPGLIIKVRKVNWLSITDILLQQWFSNCGTRTTSGTRRPSRWYAKTFTVVREEAYFLFFFTKNIFTAVVFTCRVLLINSWIFVLPTSLAVF